MGVDGQVAVEGVTPPKPNTSAIQAPAAEAMPTPSATVPARSARSIKQGVVEYRAARLSSPSCDATMLWMLADRDESPVVSGS